MRLQRQRLWQRAYRSARSEIKQVIAERARVQNKTEFCSVDLHGLRFRQYFLRANIDDGGERHQRGELGVQAGKDIVSAA